MQSAGWIFVIPYMLDDQLVIAAYPTTPRKKDVPAIQVSKSHPLAKFVLEDLEELAIAHSKTPAIKSVPAASCNTH